MSHPDLSALRACAQVDAATCNEFTKYEQLATTHMFVPLEVKTWNVTNIRMVTILLLCAICYLFSRMSV